MQEAVLHTLLRGHGLSVRRTHWHTKLPLKLLQACSKLPLDVL